MIPIRQSVSGIVRGVYCFLGFSALLTCLSNQLFGQVTFEQKSNPAGLFATSTQTKNLNEVVNTITPALSTSSHSFTHWTVNGVRENAQDGQAKNRVTVTLTENTTAIAHYIADNNDSDSDGVPDWFEIRMFGNLNHDASYDGDNDGVTLAEERQFGLAATIKDDFMEGGASIRRSSQVFANFGGAKKLTVASDPPGLLTSSETFPETNSSFTSPNKNGLTNGHYFSHWEINGVRQADNQGLGLSQISLNMNEDKMVVAKYFPENEDTDSDGLPDWFEWHEFGSLDNNASSDPDADGLVMSEERQFGLSAVIKDEFMEGGASIRRSSQVFANFGGAKKLTVASDPPGLLTSSETFPETNSSYTSPNKNGLTNGHYFSHWEINGVRQADSQGVGLSQISLNIDGDKTIIAKYYPENEDTDSDGLPDWFEWHEFGSLDNNASSDPDADGMLMSEERQFGLSAVIKDEFMEGGGSIRRSSTIGYIEFLPSEDADGDGLNKAQELALGTSDENTDSDGDGFSDGLEVSYGSDPTDSASIANSPPSDLNSTTQLSFLENLSVGTVIGEFNATDPDGDPLSFSLTSGNGDSNNSLFTLESNGSLKTAVIFDYENNATTYTIRIKVQDNHQQASVGIFILSLLDVIEDSDNDGYSDVIEQNQGSDPDDNTSFPGTDYRNVDLSNFDANNPNLFDLIYGNFEGVNLNGKRMRANFDGANFKNATLTGGDSSGAKFMNANLSGANLSGRNFHDANFSNAILADANFTTSWFTTSTVWPLGFDYINSGAFGPEVDFRNLDLSIFDANNPNYVHLKNGNFEGVNLNGKRLRANFDGANFKNATLTGGDSSGAKFMNANLSGANLSGRNFHDANFSNAILADANFTTSWFTTSTVWPLGFDYINSGAFGPEVDFRNLDLSIFDANNPNYVHLKNGNFEGVNLNGKRLRANFDGANFKNATLTGGDSSGAKFMNANLSGANLSGRNFHGANFSNAILADANFTRSWFTTSTVWPLGFDFINSGAFGPGVDFRNLDLSIFDANNPNYVHLKNGNFEGVNLNGKRLRANFDGANFKNATLTGGDSSGAKFMNANLSGANLSGRNFSGATFSGAIYDTNTTWPNGFDPVAAGAILNHSPTDLNTTSVFSINENQPIGTVIGEFNATDPDANSSISYNFVNGENNNSFFTINPNGTLKTATTFDYESNASSYVITVQAKDELNATAEGNFSISLLNLIEDFDQDGIEDHYDSDDDNDGFTDVKEIAYGSDPRDGNSTANAPPQITLGSTFPDQLDASGVFHIGHVENQTDIIRVTATDPDGDDLNYSIYGWQDLHHFEINASSGDVRFKLAPDFEEQTDHNKDGVYGIVLRVSDGHVHTDQPVWIWLQNENEAPTDLNASGDLQFLEEQPAGILVGNFSAHDSDANTTLTFSMLDGNESSGNQYFILDPNGTLTTAQVFDYENNESNYSIRVRVSDELNASREGTFVIQLLNDPSDDFNSPDSNYTSPSGGYQTPPGDYQSPDGNYSSPSSDYQTHGTDYQSPSNSYQPPAENNQSIADQNQSLGDPNRQIYVPIVETFRPDHDGNGTYHLGGRILTDGGSSPFEVGIVISTKISLSNPIRIASLPDQNSSVFHVSYADLLPGKTYYLRAYAVNQAGENQGSLKKFKTAQKIDPDSWYSVAEALPGGWKMSDWLGAFRPTEHQWIYHAEMGWLYPSPMEDGSLWLWNQADGWRWTQKGVYPYLFRWKDSAWVYLQGQINGRILYYNYSTQSYE